MGCHIVADLAGYLGYHAESEFYRVIGKGLTDSINKFMWNEEREAYFSYNIIEGKHVPQLIGYTFDVFRFNIAPPERCEKLISKLTDPDLFNWGNIPLTTIAKTDDSFISYKGDFKQKAWDGNVWTLKNMIIIDGLKDIGRYDLSAELNWKTIQVFNANYAEFIEPDKGTGFGVRRYCWSAAQYIQAIIQNLFGIEYDQIANQLLISPSIPSELIGKKLSIRNLHIPSMDQNRLDLSILMSADGDLTIELDLQNKLDGLKTVIQYNYPATIKDIKVIDLLKNKKAEMNCHPYYSKGALAVPLPVREEYKVMIHRIK
jgi:glycogen debranching enzyme